MSTLIESLKAQIARLEAKHGSDHPYVKDLKEQLRASVETSGKSAQDVYRMQAVDFSEGSRPTMSQYANRADYDKALREMKDRELKDRLAKMTPDQIEKLASDLL